MVTDKEYYEHNQKEYMNYMTTHPPNWAQHGNSTVKLLELLEALEFDTLLEIGMGYGMNALNILNRFPKTTFSGFDLHPDQIKEAREYLKDHDVTIWVGDVIKDNYVAHYDIVLSSTVLSHIPPQFVGKAIENTVSASRKHVITIEPTPNTVIRSVGDQWAHDLRKLFEAHGWEQMMEIPVDGFPLEILMFEEME